MLQVWMPLNGKIENCGLAGNDFTVSGTPAYVDGITGKALSTGAVSMSASMTSKVLNNQHFTYCCWFYVNADTGSNNMAMIFGNNSMDTNNNRKFSIFQYPTCNDLHLSWMNDAASTTYISTVLTGVLPSKKWTHICVAYDNPTAKVYINGVVQGTYTCASNSSSFAYVTQLIHNSPYHYMADIRIYDNALSPKEIHEIAQGLCLHYPLNDSVPTASRNKYGGDNFEGKASYNTSGITVTKLGNERGYNYKINYTGTGSDNWLNFSFPVFGFTAGKTYDYSCKVRCKSKNFDVSFRAAHIFNDWVTSMRTITVADSKWHEYHIQLKLDAKWTRSGTEYDTTPLIEFYTNDLKTKDTVYTADFDLKDVQVCECDTAAPVSNGAWADNTVYDTSGFGNHGNVTSAGMPTFVADSPRYDGCYKFGADDYISAKNPISSAMTSFSIACWVNTAASITRTIYTARTGVGDGIAVFMMSSNSVRLDDGTQTNFEYSLAGYANQWVHVCVTRDTTAKKLYINGVLVSTKNSVGDMSKIGTHGTIGASESQDDGIATGNYINGMMSDFRIYATALSDVDIAALYNTPVSVTSNGAMVIKGEVIEA